MAEPTISVVIPNLHSPLIGQVVEALEQQTARQRIREIIVVGQDRYGRVPPAARFIATPTPLSAAAARNLGAKAASGDYLLFLDADCLAAPDLVERLAGLFAQGRTVVSGSMAVEPSNYWVLCDNLLSFASFLASAEPGPRPYLPSFNFGITRTLFEEMSGFDEGFAGAAGEDVELSLRLLEAGHELYFDPALCVTHRPARTSARAMADHLRMFGRAYYKAQRMHGINDRSPLLRIPASFAGLVIALSPLLACKDILLSFYNTGPLQRFPYVVAGMIWGKMAWYLGIAEALFVYKRT